MALHKNLTGHPKGFDNRPLPEYLAQPCVREQRQSGD